MKDKRAGDVMIPISKYVTVSQETSLVEVLQALENARASEQERAHRDVIVVTGSGDVIGKVTMLDIFRALEPNYRKVFKNAPKGTLTKGFVRKAMNDFNLWMEPVQSICARGGNLKVSEVMHRPESIEFIDEDDPLEKALHLYVMGVHQPLIVKKDGTITGILRFGDIFEEVRTSILACV